MIIYNSLAGVSELADEADSKSVDGNIVRVQVPPPASFKSSLFEDFFISPTENEIYVLSLFEKELS